MVQDNENKNEICSLLRIEESIFEGYELPETVEDVFIFFSTEISDPNNIPFHIKEAQTYIRSNRIQNIDENKEVIVDVINKNWFVYHVKCQLDILNKKDNKKDKQHLLKVHIASNIFKLCIDNFDIYKDVGDNFIKMCKSKLEEVSKLEYHTYNYDVILKAKQLHKLHVENDL